MKTSSKRSRAVFYRITAPATLALATLAGGLSYSPGEALSKNLTKQQVKEVCGKGLQSGGGNTGCAKSCGQGNKQICDYNCNDKTGKCTGKQLTTRQLSRWPVPQHAAKVAQPPKGAGPKSPASGVRAPLGARAAKQTFNPSNAPILKGGGRR